MRISDWSSDVCSSDLTLSESRQKPPAGLPVPPAGQRRRVAAMNHIAASAPPRQQTGLAILMGQDHRTLVSEHGALNRHHLSSLDTNGKMRSEEHTSELQSLMRISYAVFCLKKKNIHNIMLHNTKSNQQNNS